MSLCRSSAVVFLVAGTLGACPSNWDGRLELLWDWSQDAMMPEMDQHRQYTKLGRKVIVSLVDVVEG